MPAVAGLDAMPALALRLQPGDILVDGPQTAAAVVVDTGPKAVLLNLEIGDRPA